MTNIYFVRHAQPVHNWRDNATRPLSEEGINDTKKVIDALKDTHLDYAICSPYQRSIDTIKDCAKFHGLEIHTDDRLRERTSGFNGNNMEMFYKRWSDMDYYEDGGESLGSVQDRNIQAIMEILKYHEGKNILVGTHGTALSTILNYFDKSFNCDSFFRIIDYMPYIIKLTFNESKLVNSQEILIVEKVFNTKDLK